MVRVGLLCGYGIVTNYRGAALQPVTGRVPVTGVGAGASGTGGDGGCVVGAPGVVGEAGGELMQVQVGPGVVGVGVGVGSGHFTQKTFCLAAPFSPVKFQKSL